MAFDIYGETLEKGHCEVHPHINQEYPCFQCNEDKKRKDGNDNISLSRRIFALEEMISSLEQRIERQ